VNSIPLHDVDASGNAVAPTDARLREYTSVCDLLAGTSLVVGYVAEFW
jgi:hypothetical protein